MSFSGAADTWDTPDGESGDMLFLGTVTMTTAAVAALEIAISAAVRAVCVRASFGRLLAPLGVGPRVIGFHVARRLL